LNKTESQRVQCAYIQYMRMCAFVNWCTDEAEQAEAMLMLNGVLRFERRQMTDCSRGNNDDDDDDDGCGGGGDRAADAAANQSATSEALPRILHSLAMLHYLLRDSDKAKFRYITSRNQTFLLRKFSGGFRGGSSRLRPPFGRRTDAVTHRTPGTYQEYGE